MELSKEYKAARKQAAQENTDPLAVACRTQQLLDVAANAVMGKLGKRAKHAFIEATMPELKGGLSRQSAHGEASTTKGAIARAFGSLLRSVKGKRISVISAKISITTKTVEDAKVNTLCQRPRPVVKVVL